MSTNIFTFTVDPNSKFYNDYFAAKAEKQKFAEVAKPFTEKYDINYSYYVSKTLAIKIPLQDKHKFEEQLVKKCDERGFYKFKARSPIAKAWEEEVVSKVDFRKMEHNQFWWMPYLNAGRYAMWDAEGVIYGYLENKYDTEIKPADWMQPIKVSEYYVAVEKYEDKE